MAGAAAAAQRAELEEHAVARLHARVGMPAEAPGGATVTTDAPVGSGDVDIGSATALGCPFVSTPGREAEVGAAYAELLRGGRTAKTIAIDRQLPLHAVNGRMKLQARLQALGRLAERVRAGERLRLCSRYAVHGVVIVEWIKRRS